MFARWRLGRENVDRGTGELATLKHRQKSVQVDERATRCVDEVRPARHQRQLASSNQLFVVLREWQMERDRPTAAQQVLERRRRDAGCCDLTASQEWIARPGLNPQTAGSPGN